MTTHSNRAFETCLNLCYRNLDHKDLHRILGKLAVQSDRTLRPRKKQRRRGKVEDILVALPSTVTHLGLAGNSNVGDAGTTHLTRLLPDTVIDLDLTRCGLTPAGVERLGTFLETKNTSVTRMRLSENRIEDEGASSLARMISVNTTLLRLDLVECDIGTGGFVCLGAALERNETLRELSLSSDDTGDEQVLSLCVGLKKNRCLESLDLSGGQRITNTGVGYLEEMLRRDNMCLKRVSLATMVFVVVDNEDEAAFSISLELRQVINTYPGSVYHSMMSWLSLNGCNRKLVKDHKATTQQWVDAVIASSELPYNLFGQSLSLNSIYFFVRNKPDLCSLI